VRNTSTSLRRASANGPAADEIVSADLIERPGKNSPNADVAADRCTGGVDRVNVVAERAAEGVVDNA
jgi:hypothetical protein